MDYLENQLCTVLYQQRLEDFCQQQIDLATSDRNRLFIADTIREVGLTNSIQKRFNAYGELDHLFQMAGIESLGSSVSNEDLANAIIGTEGFLNSAADVVNKTVTGFAADLGNIFLSGYRWFQSLTDSSIADADRLKQLLRSADENKKYFSKQAINAIDLNQIKKIYTNANTVNARARACQTLKDLSVLSVFTDRDVLDNKRKEAAQLHSDMGTAKSNIGGFEKKPMVAAEVYKQAKAMVPIVIKALNDIVETNDRYRGYWHTGFSAGKLSALFPGSVKIASKISANAAGNAATNVVGKIAGKSLGSGLGLTIGGALVGSWLFSDVRTIAGFSWNTISRATSIDYELCRMLMSNLKALNRLTNE
jgi:hypothetical protein